MRFRQRVDRNAIIIALANAALFQADDSLSTGEFGLACALSVLNGASLAQRFIQSEGVSLFKSRVEARGDRFKHRRFNDRALENTKLFLLAYPA